MTARRHGPPTTPSLLVYVVVFLPTSLLACAPAPPYWGSDTVTITATYVTR